MADTQALRRKHRRKQREDPDVNNSPSILRRSALVLQPVFVRRDVFSGKNRRVEACLELPPIAIVPTKNVSANFCIRIMLKVAQLEILVDFG
jgi:hypothetical protein